MLDATIAQIEAELDNTRAMGSFADAVADALSAECPSAALAGLVPRFAWFQMPARP